MIKAWEGLGYYRRARNLQALARAAVERGGKLPRNGEDLRALPGIGPYTAAAIGSISFGLPLAVLDGNVMRVLTRLLACADDIALPKTRAKLQLAADVLLDRRDPATHNQAMMELGATICVPRKPLCLLCPLKRDCLGKERAEEFPVKTRTATVKRVETIAVPPARRTLLLRAGARGQAVAWPLEISRLRSSADDRGAGRSRGYVTASRNMR